MKFLSWVLVFFFVAVNAQHDGFHFQNGKSRTTVPFQFISNLIFIPITVNGVELTFLVDSGVAETILFSLENKEIDFENAVKTKFSGLGGQTDVEGYEAVNNRMQIGRHITDESQTLYIIPDPDFNISSHIGIPINGVIGYQMFKNFKIRINYQTRKMTFFAPDENIALNGYEEFPLEVQQKKPYIGTYIQQNGEEQQAKMLVDLGNSDAVWLFTSLLENEEIKQPHIDDYLGRGFNGDIHGKRSRIHHLRIGKFLFRKATVAIPDRYSLQNLTLVKDRKGSVGDEILKRFHLVTDYPNNKIYLKPNRFHRDPFTMDMSGLDVRHNGMRWETDLVKVENPAAITNAASEIPAYSSKGEFQYKFTLKPEYIVAGTRKDSPAQLAGITKNDKIMKINGRNTAEMKLDRIREFMKSESGRKIILEVERNGKPLKFEFTLKDPIPYIDEN